MASETERLDAFRLAEAVKDERIVADVGWSAMRWAIMRGADTVNESGGGTS